MVARKPAARRPLPVFKTLPCFATSVQGRLVPQNAAVPRCDFFCAMPENPGNSDEYRLLGSLVWSPGGLRRTTPAAASPWPSDESSSQLLHSLETAVIIIHARRRCIIAAVPKKTASARNRKSRA